MGQCPVCHAEIKRRVDGKCPDCETSLNNYGGNYYREEIGNPSVALLEYTEKLISKKLSLEQSTVVRFSVPRKSPRYKRELIAAERLLTLCSGSYELAAATINTIFTDPRYGWKARDGVMSLERDFLIALTVTKARIERDRQAAANQQKNLAAVVEREDIFA